MAMFIVRVELLDADENDYEKLWESMARLGFEKTITGSNGIEYHLPPAEYHRVGTYTVDQIRDHAHAAADSTGCANRVLVSEATSISWTNLLQVTP